MGRCWFNGLLRAKLSPWQQSDWRFTAPLLQHFDTSLLRESGALWVYIVRAAKQQNNPGEPTFTVDILGRSIDLAH
jgi:hypothetical protein